jgi:hypothetical protein
LVGESLACVSGDVVHLYHGTRKNRRYVERYRIFHDHAYDPVGDVEIDWETGLLQWSNAAPVQKAGLVRRLADNFERRRKDERIVDYWTVGSRLLADAAHAQSWGLSRLWLS